MRSPGFPPVFVKPRHRANFPGAPFRSLSSGLCLKSLLWRPISEFLAFVSLRSVLSLSRLRSPEADPTLLLAFTCVGPPLRRSFFFSEDRTLMLAFTCVGPSPEPLFGLID